MQLDARRHPVCDRICRDAAGEHHVDRDERTTTYLPLHGGAAPLFLVTFAA
jgi:hypothetical protein